MRTIHSQARRARAVVVLICIGLLASCKVDKEALARSVDLHDVDLSTVADGTYEATYTIHPPVMAANKTISVRVTVAGKAYTAIEIVSHPRLSGDKSFTDLIGKITSTGHLSMDAISGATVTSTALLKAVQLAVSGKQ